MKLIHKTQQFQTDELKDFLKKISKGINTNNILVIVKKPWGREKYYGNVQHWDYGLVYRNNGGKIRTKTIIKVGVSKNNNYPFTYLFSAYGYKNPILFGIVKTPLNMLGLVFLHELYGAKLARNGKRHYEHQCDAWAYKKGKELGLFIEGGEDGNE